MENNNRGTFSRLGFILAAAGSAIGLGNLWKFPYLAGKNGGGAFVLIYLALVVLVGFVVMLGEMAIGRNTKLNPINAYKKLNKKWETILQDKVLLWQQILPLIFQISFPVRFNHWFGTDCLC